MRVLTAVLSVAAVIAAGCGSSSSSSSTTTTAAAPASTASAPASTTATTTTTASANLSGKWSGQYSGVYTGTFTLNWTQSGSNLRGSIQLSSPAKTLSITGNVAGSAIKFGAVGGVTYSGTVSANSMSGTYQNPAPASGSGSWSATKG
jgi:hypothetical protein